MSRYKQTGEGNKNKRTGEARRTKPNSREKQEKQNKRDHRRQYRNVIRELTSREIKRKYSRSKLGIIWSVLQPLLMMIVMSLIFSQMFQRSIENFPIYYLVGWNVWSLFSTATTTAMTGLVDNKSMLIKVKFPMGIFVISRVNTALVNFLYSLIAFAAIVIFFEIRDPWMISPWIIVILPMVVLCELLFSLGISYILAAAYVFYGDVKHLYSVVTTMWMYLSAIFYPVDLLGKRMEALIRWNPVFDFIDALRQVILYGTLPPYFELLRIAAYAVAVYLIGHAVFTRSKDKIMQKI